MNATRATWSTIVALLLLNQPPETVATAAEPPATSAGEAPPTPDRTPARFEALPDSKPIPQSPWRRYFTADELDRTITFYVAQPNSPPAGATLPIILYIQGSGSQSIFSSIDTPSGARSVPSGGQGSVRDAAANRAIVVAVEKPGVRFLDSPSRPGSAEEGSQQFREEHTLSRWSIAISAALKAALTLPNADPTRILVEGHSEGGLVACKVAADNPNVTHVATLAGGGPTQLFDLIDLARRGELCGDTAATAQECADRLLAQWEAVLQQPDSPDHFFLGHPHRRWTTFLATSPIEQLRRTNARVFIGQGTEDRATSTAGADMLYATLRADGRNVTYRRVPGDHAFSDPTATPPADGWKEMHASVIRWFLEGQ